MLGYGSKRIRNCKLYFYFDQKFQISASVMAVICVECDEAYAAAEGVDL